MLTDEEIRHLTTVTHYSSVVLTALAGAALVVNLYLLNCSRYLRRPVSLNLRLCISLTFSDALCSLCYIMGYAINVLLAPHLDVPKCWILLIEVFRYSSFFAAVFTLLILALNHYIGLVYPLSRHAISNKTLKAWVATAYAVPFVGFFILFTLPETGFRASRAFAFFDPQGCKDATILRDPFVRRVVVVPFIVAVMLLSFLYLHILFHMGKMGKDTSLLSSKPKCKKSTNRKLLVTLMLLAGSAIIGWLPTIVSFILVCPSSCLLKSSTTQSLYIGVLTQLVHIVKLLLDAFIYASRLIEVRYAMWTFNTAVRSFCCFWLGEADESEVPKEFAKYLRDTRESRSSQRRRVSELHASFASTATGRSVRRPNVVVQRLSQPTSQQKCIAGEDENQNQTNVKKLSSEDIMLANSSSSSRSSSTKFTSKSMQHQQQQSLIVLENGCARIRDVDVEQRLGGL